MVWGYLKRLTAGSGFCSAPIPGLQGGAIPAVGQEPLGEVEPFLKLGELGRLIGQTRFGVFQGGRVLFHLLPEPGQLGSRAPAPADGSRNGPRHQDRRGGGDGERQEENLLSHRRPGEADSTDWGGASRWIGMAGSAGWESLGV